MIEFKIKLYHFMYSKFNLILDMVIHSLNIESIYKEMINKKSHLLSDTHHYIHLMILNHHRHTIHQMLVYHHHIRIYISN